MSWSESFSYPRLAGAFADPRRVVDLVRELAEVVDSTVTVNVASDPDDNRVLEAADAGQATHIITGDRDLLDVGQHNGIGIVMVVEFLKHLSSLPG